MLSTTASTTTTSTVRIKSLETRLCSTEQKDLELESEELPNNQPAEESEEEQETIEEFAAFSGLSARATEIKDLLSAPSSVKAVLLKQDGTSEEISYDGTSEGTRKLLSGRPSIIGEIEDLQVVAVKSLKGGDKNQHTLPVPLCNNKSQGDLVLFRVDSSGKPSDVTLQEYQQYVDAHKTLTATAVKNYSADGEQIQANSPFDTSAKLSMLSVRGALETQIVAMAEEDESTKKSDAEIEKEVMEGLQKLVDEAVASLSASPMEDPDYDPEEEGLDETADLEVVGNGLGIDEVDEDTPWNEQLKDALNHVRAIGKADGAAFAEMVCSTFYELNGSEPSLNKLTDLYDRIKKDFANEAEEQSEEEEEEEIDAESEEEEETEIESEESLEIADDWEGTLDHIRDIARKDGRSLAENACDLFYDVNGDEPTLEELTELWQLIQDELAAEAEEELDEIDIESESESEAEEAEEEEEEESPYDPNNTADQKLAQKDAVEDKKHEFENFDQVVLNTPMVTAKSGGGVSWNMYFNEGDLNEEAESSKLVKTLEGFKMMNQREPTPLELRKMKMFLSVPNDLVDDEDAMSTELTTSKTGGGASWSVYYDETSGSLENALRSFVQFHQRQPSSSEVDQIRSFLSLPTSETVEEEATALEARCPSKVLVSPVAEKKAAKRFNVYLEDSKLSQKETEEIAVKWFERFNKKKPSDSDLEQIRSFIAKDADLTEQQFMIPVKALDFDVVDDDDVKESDVSSKSVTKKMVTKKAATGYTLNFEDDEKRDIGDEEEAMKWFKRFNNREPSDGEKQQIKQFVKGDEEEMIDIE